MFYQKFFCLLLGISAICVSGYADAKPSSDCPLDAKLKDGQCVCGNRPIYGNDRSENENYHRLTPYMQKFKSKIRNCLTQDINQTFSNIDPESLELESLASSANSSNKSKIKQYLKTNIHISMDITVNIDMRGKLTVFATVNEETNLLGDYVGSCLEDVFSEASFCPASKDESTVWDKDISLKMLYHYQQNILIRKDKDKDQYYEIESTNPPDMTLRHSCSCCGSVYTVPVGQSCKVCSCQLEPNPEDEPQK